jgi:D-alanyl-D-alanine carboxypeptidase
MPRNPNFIFGSRTKVAAALYLAVVLIMTVIIMKHSAPQMVAKEEVRSEESKAAGYFKDLRLEAKAVYVFDADKGAKLYGKDENAPLPLASVTKIATALCALRNLDQNGYVTIPPSVLGDDGDPDLKAGESMRVRDLVSYTLVKSSNDGAMALASALGGVDTTVECMNRIAEEEGLFDTEYRNVTGLDIAGSAGAYGSALDSTKMLLVAMREYPAVFGTTRYESYNVQGETEHEAVNTNKAQGEIVGMQSSKTGLTDIAGGNLVFIMNAGLGHTVVVAILGSTEEGRFKDAILLSEAVIHYLGTSQ